MTSTVSGNSQTSLQTCIDLASDLSRHDEANEAFGRLVDTLDVENPVVAELVNALWSELLSAQRSATVWEKICTVERELTERLTMSNFQLQQNYLRLVQEQ
ncbi:hypothetical protein H6G89_27730 [Oscillatoria sp. FACHB-1407]|uniref:hypothetical protein n=1 Tax=Oscillatoria sp. FACHB-1407 TaxID=2692847 RepID=UPI001687C21F|nr:hypothetical protein [Oscillatoria sp. FACHB-1407]MBD2464797.1 hypothetical protein [Oscillatoria sp. FACHB-1407]